MVAILFALFFSWNSFGVPQAADCGAKKLPRFEEHETADIYNGRAHPPVLATALDRKYKTTIRNAATVGTNFSGHFAIASWGCGTGCQEFVIVDLKTGTVYDPSFVGVVFHYGPKSFNPTPGWQCYPDLLMFRRDSSLLVVEGCLLRGEQCGRTYLLMEPGRLRQVAYDPDQIQDRAASKSR